MKTYLLFKTALLASVMCVSFAAAQRQDSTAGKPVQPADVSVPAATEKSTEDTATAPVDSGSSNATSKQLSAPEMLISSGDLLQVRMYGADDFSSDSRVNSGGEISLPLIGTVRVAGLSTQGAERLIETRLKDGGFYTSPSISVVQKEFTTQGISVLGEVQKPGIYPLPGQRKLFDAISAAGGVTLKASNTVLVSHRDGSPTRKIVISKDPAQQMEGNIDVIPGDTVVVTRAGIVYVVGDVKLPGGFVMEHGRMSVLQAMSMAQGANLTAALGHSKVIRRGEDGNKEIALSIKNILAGKAPDQSLLDEDILFIPTSGPKSAAYRSLDAVIKVATGMAIYK
jgi:polysaccharide export outer membrane protein